MATVKFTKTELRNQQVRLGQLQKYLPTLQLKKGLLQLEVEQAENLLEQWMIEWAALEHKIQSFAGLLTHPSSDALFAAVAIDRVQFHEENIAGIDVPVFEELVFYPAQYALFDTPFWVESAVKDLKDFLIIREKIRLLREKKRRLEKELREVSIRVNLFEKIMIPRTQDNIKKIKIFLGDMQLAAVSQAKASKKKIIERKSEAKPVFVT